MKERERESLAEWQNIAPVYHVLVSLTFRFLSNNELNLDFSVYSAKRNPAVCGIITFDDILRSTGKISKVFKYICECTCMYHFAYLIYLFLFTRA